MTFSLWLALLISCTVICISPGPGAVASMSSGAVCGSRRAIWTVVGLEAGLLIQLFIVAVGLGTLLVASQTAFLVVKWLGVCYLAYLGIQLWRARPMVSNSETDPALRISSARELFLRGMLINATNPKATIFLVAILPQFIKPHASMAVQWVEIMATMVFVDTGVMITYTHIGSRVLAAMRSPAHQKILNRTFGTFFLGAAALLASYRRTA